MPTHLPRRAATRYLSPRIIAAAALMALVALAAACRVDEIVSTTEPVTGPGTVYALASANDSVLAVPADPILP